MNINPPERQKLVVCLLPLGVLALCLLSAGHAAPAKAQPRARSLSGALASQSLPRPRYAYLMDGAGGYVKVDTEQQQVVSRGNIWEAPRRPSGSPDTGVEVRGSLVDQIRFDAARNLLYVMARKVGPSRTGEDDESRLVALAVPGFDLVSKTGVLDCDYTPLLLDREGGSLLALCPGRTDRYSLPELKQVATYDIASESTVSSSVHWNSRGDIVDWNWVMDEEGRPKRSVQGDKLLTPSIRAKFQPILDAHKNWQLVAIYAHSAGDRMLFMVGGDEPSEPVHGPDGLLTFDVVTGQTLPPIVVPYGIGGIGFGRSHLTAHLNPTGKLIVTEKFEWRAAGEIWHNLTGDQASHMEEVKTGQIDVYDADSGIVARTVQLDPPPAPYSFIVGFSPDGGLMYYESADHIYAVELTGDSPPQVIRGANPEAMYLFFSPN